LGAIRWSKEFGSIATGRAIAYWKLRSSVWLLPPAPALARILLNSPTFSRVRVTGKSIVSKPKVAAPNKRSFAMGLDMYAFSLERSPAFDTPHHILNYRIPAGGKELPDGPIALGTDPQ